MELGEETKKMRRETANERKGRTRRLFMARTGEALGKGGQRVAEREVGWNRTTIRQGQKERSHESICLDASSSRGRMRSDDHLPHGRKDITAMVDGQRDADPHCRTTRLSTRLTAADVRRQWCVQKGSTDEELPTAETMGRTLNALGDDPQKVATSQPKKPPGNRRHRSTTNADH